MTSSLVQGKLRAECGDRGATEGGRIEQLQTPSCSEEGLCECPTCLSGHISHAPSRKVPLKSGHHIRGKKIVCETGSEAGPRLRLILSPCTGSDIYKGWEEGSCACFRFFLPPHSSRVCAPLSQH